MTQSPTSEADTYRSELMGIYLSLTLVLAICELHVVKVGMIRVGCDNLRAIELSSARGQRVPNRRKHSDILKSIRMVCFNLPITIDFFSSLWASR